MHLFHSRYDEITQILYGTHHSGFYSCINEVRNTLYKLVTHKIYPKDISFSETLGWYRGNEDLYPILYKKCEESMESIKSEDFDFEYFCPTELNLSWLDYDDASKVENAYFLPSDYVQERVVELEKKYDIDYSNTLAIFHRGTDKGIEATLRPLGWWIDNIRGETDEPFRILIQTDEKSFKDGFLDAYGESGFTFDEMIFRDGYVTPHRDKVQWAIDYESIMRIISKCKKIVTHSGNGGIIPIIYRANLEGVSQCYKDGDFMRFYK